MSQALANPARDLKALAAEINKLHDEAVNFAEMAVDHAVDCGRRLLEAKALLAHGEWLPWLKANTSVSARQSQKYMRLAERLHEIEAVATDEMDAIAKSASHFILDGALKLIAEPKPTAEAERAIAKAEGKKPKAPVEGSDEYERDRAQCIALYQKAVEAERELADCKPPEPDDKGSWGVEAVGMDGRVWRDGVRLKTREEAEFHIEYFVSQKVEGFAAAAIFKSDDRAQMGIVGKKRKTLLFEHGTCGLLDMKPVDKKPDAETIEAVKAKARDWNNLVAKLASGRSKACPKCHGIGSITSKKTGTTVDCDCVRERDGR